MDVVREKRAMLTKRLWTLFLDNFLLRSNHNLEIENRVFGITHKYLYTPNITFLISHKML